ncbi:hypothetical protein D7Y13_00335 [Corallococcus praedator]|uniref:DUF3137 domain-containing protein n=1 Tax=Corallococcus praedator TaxID=2316724 RepID=A0ABX9QRM3_9BACT|nr:MULTISPECIES: hypothetical protein [Corallococcus]RKH21809.1 hypothetical protein D7X74_00305 [Corallococcus sp. CA047B]RKH36518.1 hypothetical protein D7X75_00405 [Corallococcus sp. CA031C]RKI17770.1 hypothetical protein D7Y13_00335 [Corallococcus praedator]
MSTPHLRSHIRRVGNRFIVLGGAFVLIGALLLWRVSSVLGGALRGGVLLFGMTGSVGAFGLVGLALGLVWRLKPELHPNLRWLHRGGPGTLDEAERELAAAMPAARAWGLIMAPNFAFTLLPLTFQARRLQSLAWVHGAEEEVRHNGVLIQTNHLVKLRFTDQPSLSVAFRDPPARNVFLDSVRERWPHVVVGYDAALEKLWRTDKARFTATTSGRAS